ncbi:unnamed protein product, partial [Mesorhabditis belari]|uniref:Uncharacterized protein n=1 Tax=Mesorhabditis belari TaxID=2138241 RepID=A0AAF3F500_9BILA
MRHRRRGRRGPNGYGFPTFEGFSRMLATSGEEWTTNCARTSNRFELAFQHHFTQIKSSYSKRVAHQYVVQQASTEADSLRTATCPIGTNFEESLSHGSERSIRITNDQLESFQIRTAFPNTTVTETCEKIENSRGGPTESHSITLSCFDDLSEDDGWNDIRQQKCQETLRKEATTPAYLEDVSEDDGWNDVRQKKREELHNAYEQQKKSIANTPKLPSVNEYQELNSQKLADGKALMDSSRQSLNSINSLSSLVNAGGDCRSFDMAQYFLRYPTDEWQNEELSVEMPSCEEVAQSMPSVGNTRKQNQVKVEEVYLDSDDDADNAELFVCMFSKAQPTLVHKSSEDLLKGPTHVHKSWKYGILLNCFEVVGTNDLEFEILNFDSKAVTQGKIGRAGYENLPNAVGQRIRWRDGLIGGFQMEDATSMAVLQADHRLRVNGFMRVSYIGLSSYVSKEFWQRYRRVNVRNSPLSWPIWTSEYGFFKVPFSRITTSARSDVGTLKPCVITLAVDTRSLKNDALAFKIIEATFLEFFEQCFVLDGLTRFDDLTLNTLMVQSDGTRTYIFESPIFPNVTFQALEDRCEPEIEDYCKAVITDPKQLEGQKKQQFQGVFYRNPLRENVFCALVVGRRRWMGDKTEGRLASFTSASSLELIRRRARGGESQLTHEQLRAHVDAQLIMIPRR